MLGAVVGVAVAVVGQVLSQGIDGTDSGRPFLHDRNTQLRPLIGAGVGAMVGAALARGEQGHRRWASTERAAAAPPTNEPSGP